MPLTRDELAALFPPENFAFRLTLQRGVVADFFGGGDPRVLAERRGLLAQAPKRYSAFEPAASAAVREFATTVGAGLSAEELSSGDPVALMIELGGQIEPDFVFLLRDELGVFRLRAGVVCFPSFWDLGEKMNQGLTGIHGPVPGLNSALAPAIDRFLARLKPGAAFSRSNWGLAATPALNLHPQAGQPRLGTTLDPARTWLRIEEQILFALPACGAVVFGIRVSCHPLISVLEMPEVRAGFHRAVATMPPELAAYKGFGPLQTALFEFSR